MFDIDTLRTDPEKANEGTWVNYRGKSRLKLAKLNNREYQDFRARQALEHADVLQREDEAADAKAEEITVEALARFVIKDWAGFGQGGEDLAYTPEVGMKLLSDPEFADFREDVINLSSLQANFRPEAAAEAVKPAAAS